MARYPTEYGPRRGERWIRLQERFPEPGEAELRGRRRYRRSDYGYEGDFAGGRGIEYGREHDSRAELERRWRSMRLPRKSARGFPIRGYHTYDLDYGGQVGGPTTDYSGRAGYPILRSSLDEEPPRGPYTPTLEETERYAGGGRTLYGGESRAYPARRAGGRRGRGHPR